MKFFGKNVSKKVRKDLLLRLATIVVAGILLVFFAAFSFGWFSSKQTVSPNPMQIGIPTEKYDLLIERTSEYDAGYQFIAGEDEVKDKLAEESFSFLETSSAADRRLALEMRNEYVYEGQRYLMPGSYGTVVFYIRPRANVGDFTATFSLSLGAYALVYDGETPRMQTVTSEVVLHMLQGHFLFFTGRTGATYEDYIYTGLIDETFSYDTSLHTTCSDPGKTDCYKITLYWEWPITYYDITDNLSTTSPEVTKKYPAAVWTYLTAHNDYFFPVSVEGGTEEERSDAYNDGDQTIGDGANGIVLYLTAS